MRANPVTLNTSKPKPVLLQKPVRKYPVTSSTPRPYPAVNKQYQVPFTYNHILKILYKKGKIKPKFDIYGDRLTKKNCTLEHIQCVSHGGKTETNNVALATARMNNARGNKPLSEFLNVEGLAYYCNYFLHLKIPEFDGVKYIKGLLETINKVLDAENAQTVHLDITV